VTWRPAGASRSAAGRALGGALALLAAGLAAPGEAAPLRIDPARSTLLLRVTRDGPAARLAHDHAIEATRFAGAIDFDPSAPEAAGVTVEVEAASLRVDEPAARRRLGLEGELSPGQRADVDRSMRAADQLDVARYPVMRFVSTRVRPEGGDLHRVTGALTIRGVTREVSFPVHLATEGRTLIVRAALSFLQSSFGYRPYRLFLGAVRTRDEVQLEAELIAEP
jgi:polyisoprenoid-binding protein YceI